MTLTEDEAADLILDGRAFRSVKMPGSWRVRRCPWSPADFGSECATVEEAGVLDRVAATLGYSTV